MLPTITPLLVAGPVWPQSPPCPLLVHSFCLSPALCRGHPGNIQALGWELLLLFTTSRVEGEEDKTENGHSSAPCFPGLFWRRRAKHQSKVNILKAAVEGEAPGKPVVGGSF